MNRLGFRTALLALFALSGFAGLIYESIWSHYLKLFLGHAAYAQTLVLSIFMGGMALGSWISSRTSRRWPNLLLAYAAVELVIGLLGVVFHGVFVRTVDFAFITALPAVQNPLLAGVIKWLLGTLLILPQSVLLGMTFPLMSAGLIRRFPATPGATLALLYFTNSIGAAVGVLVSGFVLIDVVGLPGTILTAGLINVALAIIVWALLKKQPPEKRLETAATTSVPTSRLWYRLLLGVALITGLSSFIYEIGWIRMLALVLGASTHSFELMLSAFILGLALGGLWIRKRIDTTAAPERLLAIVQIVMGGFALLSLPLYNYTFDIMQWLLQAVQRNLGGYQLFNLTSHVIAMAVMLPATFCAGMTLPLITYTLLRHGHGEKSIGAVYAANTAGAIAGVFLAVHLAMPTLGLKGLITLGAALDIALGLALIWRLYLTTTASSRRATLAWTAAGLSAVVVTTLFAGLDPLKLASGVYRSGTLTPPSENTHVLYHRDGKTSSVDLVAYSPPLTLSILTNGKADASVAMEVAQGPSVDEATMILAAALPMMHYPQARSVAVIGMGSGLTSDTFLANPAIAGVDTIEIEPAMVEGAQGFRPRNERVYTDPRSHVYIEDAKTFFSTHNRQYDIIASEPSNPWVSGVASLFSDEFYRHVRRHLRDDGLLVQWLQVYEIETPLVVSVLKALSRNFPDYAIYTPGHADILIVARKNGPLGLPDFQKLAELGLREEMERIAIRNPQDLWLRRVGSRRSLGPLFESWPVAFNSDYFPILDQNAARSRFLKQRAYELIDLANAPVPLLEMLGEQQVARNHTEVTPISTVSRSTSVAIAVGLLNSFSPGQAGTSHSSLKGQGMRNVDYLRFAAGNCQYLASSTQWEDLVFDVAVLVNSHLLPAEAQRFWRQSGLERCAAQMNASQKRWYALYKAVAGRDAMAMSRLASGLLKTSEPHAPQHDEYLLMTAMLGNLAVGNRASARALWQEQVPRILHNRPVPLSLRLLEAHSREPRQN
jgi:predicted membrane-bound spermidine synthase